MMCLKKYGLLLYLICALQLLMGQDIPYIQYTTEDGLPSMQTYQIFQDSSGLLWIGTENGLVSFDGVDFVRYTHPDLLDNDIIEMTMSAEGRIYFYNLSNQLGYLENNEINLIKNGLSKKDTLKYERFGFYSTREKDYILERYNTMNHAYEITEKEDKNFDFVLTDINLFHVDRENFYTHKDTKYHSLTDSSVILTKNPRLYSSINYYCYGYPFRRIEVHTIDSIFWKYIEGKYFARIINQKGELFHIENNNVIHYDIAKKTFKPIITESHINTVFIDMENNIWMSTADKGLLRAINSLSKLNLNANAINEGINSIHTDQLGNIYIGTLGGKMIINPLGSTKEIRVSEKTRPVNFTLFNDMMIGYTDHGIVRLDVQTLNYDKVKLNYGGFKNICYHDSTIILGGALYFYFDKFGEKFKLSTPEFPSSLIKSNNRMNKLFSSEFDSTLYVCTSNGLAYLENDKIINSKNDLLSSFHITSITGTQDTAVWLGTRADGIFSVSNDSILDYYNTEKGLISNSINNINIHGSELLVSTSNGLSIVNTSTQDIISLNTFNLLPSNNVLVCKVLDGKYWIGTSKGLTILTKDQINDVRPMRPLLTINNFMINGIIHDYTTNMNIDHTDNNVQINFQNISYKSGREKSIKYKISSVDTSWISTSDNYIRLPSLNPGKYMVEAIGVSSVGTESIPQFISFSILPPWWETNWGRVLILLFIIAVGSAIFYFRLRRENQKRIYLTQINKVKDQALQLQMNPHFIFNSLNAIQGFIGTEDEELAMNYLARFARLIRLIFEHSKDNTISLEEEIEFIQLYLDLEKLRFKDKVDTKLTVDPELDAIKDLINVPPLLIQPIAENSFKHGLFHKKSKGKISVDFDINGDLLIVTLEDDGIGRKAAKSISSKNHEKQTSSGIQTTQERIDLLNFKVVNKKNNISIEDLYHEDGSPAGTKTIIQLVIKKEG